MRIRWWMKYAQNMWIGLFVFTIFPLYDKSIGGGASYVVGCWWLPAAVSVSAASTPHLSALEVGGTDSE